MTSNTFSQKWTESASRKTHKETKLELNNIFNQLDTTDIYRLSSNHSRRHILLIPHRTFTNIDSLCSGPQKHPNKTSGNNFFSFVCLCGCTGSRELRQYGVFHYGVPRFCRCGAWAQSMVLSSCGKGLVVPASMRDLSSLELGIQTMCSHLWWWILNWTTREVHPNKFLKLNDIISVGKPKSELA